MKKITLINFLITAAFLIQAQGVLSINGASTTTPTFYVNNGANIYVAGGINIAQSGSPGGASGDYLQNNGTIRIGDGPAGQNNFNNDVSGLKVYTTSQTTGTVIFTATSQAQTIAGGGTVEFMNLGVNNTLSPTVDLNENVTVDGTLNLGGVINVEGSTLTLPATGTLAGGPYSSANMIQADGAGQFIRGVNSGAANLLFPVGDGAPAYSPVTINFAANATAGSVGLNVKPVTHPQINNPTAAHDYLERYWTFTNTGLTTYNYTGNFNYLTTDIFGTESLMRVSRWANPWYQEQNSTAGSNTLNIGSALDQTLAPLSGDFTGRNVSCTTSAGTITASKDTICSGSPQTLALVGSTSAVQWQSSATGSNFNTIPGADTTTYLTQPTQTTYYRTYASGNTCSDTSLTFKLVVNALPSPALPTIAKDTICSSDSTQICAVGNYSSYLWNTGATTSCINAKEAGGYWVNVTDQNGCSNASAHASIAVYPVSSVSVFQQGDTISSFGASAYQWFFNGVAIPGANNDFVVASQSGNYSVQITDANGCKATSSNILLGTTDLVNNMQLEIYPNPASATFNIRYTGPEAVNGYLAMYNVIGEKVMEQVVNLRNGQTMPVNVGELPKGIYLVQVESTNISLIRKIVMQ